MGDDQRLEDIEFRQEFIEKDSDSPLHLIREKEMEISGRVLKAKREAEDIVAEARRKAAEASGTAETEGKAQGEARIKEVETEFEAKVADVGKQADGDLEKMKEQITASMPDAVDAVVKMVTDV